VANQASGGAGKWNRELDAAPRRRATRIRPEGRLVLVEPQANSRLMAFLAGNFLHRIERDRCELCFGDLDLARIAEIIGLIAIEPGMRDAAFRAQHRSFESVIGIAGQRAVNAASIAAATGIPRETVRRKLKRLVALGHIVQKGRAGYVMTPGVLQRADRQTVFERCFNQIALFTNDMLEQGLLEWVPSGRVARSSQDAPSPARVLGASREPGPRENVSAGRRCR